jgi:nifR3 family TIM-barrel protein
MKTEADTDRAISISIGPHQLASRAFLAPMAGITDLPVRRMAMRFGAGLAVSEMIASDWLASGDPSALLRAEGEGVGLHVVQLAGCEAHWLAEGARVAEAAGADIIDINMGCPAKSVTNGQLAGAALLRDVEQATRMIAAVVAAVSVPVTLKMRLGWDENSIVAPELARRAEGEGVKMITVHGRTRAQFYKGDADWEAIARVKSEISIPLVANGDLTSYEDATEMYALAQADAVMIGRGAQGRAWFPGHVGRYLATSVVPDDPPLAVQRDVLLELYEAWLSQYGIARGVREARKHIGWTLEAAAQTAGRTSDEVKIWRAKLLAETDPVKVRHGICEAFDDFAWKQAA